MKGMNMASFEIEKIGERQGGLCEVWQEDGKYTNVFWTLYLRKEDGGTEALLDRGSKEEIYDLLHQMMMAAGDEARLSKLWEENDARLEN